MRRMLCMLMCLLFLPLAALAASVRVIQIWDDAEDYNGLRPLTVPVMAISDEEQLIITDSDIHEMDGTTFSFSQGELPASYVLSSYTYTEDDLITAVFINRHNVEIPAVSVQNSMQTIDPFACLTITKESERASESDIFYFRVSLPDTYSYITSRGGTGQTDELVPLHAGESAEIGGIPIGTDYTVEELTDPRFYSSCDNPSGTIAAGGTEVTFTNTLITTSFSVRKVWEGTDIGPITLRLFADGQEIEAEIERDGDVYSVYDLPKYDETGHEIVYSAKEVYMSGYMTMYINKGKYADRKKAVYNNGTIINREVVTFFVTKEWIGEPNPPEIRFQLYQNGKPIEWRQPEKTASGVYIWENLPKMKNGEEAIYSVKEIPLDGYLTKYSNPHSSVDDMALQGGKIINYKIPKTGDVENLNLWTMLAGISFVLLLLGVFYRRRCK